MMTRSVVRGTRGRHGIGLILLAGTAVAWSVAKANRSFGPLNVSGFDSVDRGWSVNLFCGTRPNDVLHRHSDVP